MVHVKNLEEFILRPFTYIKCWCFFSFALNPFFSHFWVVHHISNLVDCTRFILFDVGDHYRQCLVIVSLFISRHSFITFFVLLKALFMQLSLYFCLSHCWWTWYCLFCSNFMMLLFHFVSFLLTLFLCVFPLQCFFFLCLVSCCYVWCCNLCVGSNNVHCLFFPQCQGAFSSFFELCFVMLDFIFLCLTPCFCA